MSRGPRSVSSRSDVPSIASYTPARTSMESRVTETRPQTSLPARARRAAVRTPVSDESDEWCRASRTLMSLANLSPFHSRIAA